MKKSWKDYVDENGDFALPAFLYTINNELMKEVLDLGTLLSQDNQKLRAYKEQTKKAFKKRWLDIAQALEFFDLIVPCVCGEHEFCQVCDGSRYILNAVLNPDQLREVAIFVGAKETDELAIKL